jgi:hypothetical protein
MEPEGSLPHSQEPATCPYLNWTEQNLKKYNNRDTLSSRWTMLQTFSAYKNYINTQNITMKLKQHIYDKLLNY